LRLLVFPLQFLESRESKFEFFLGHFDYRVCRNVGRLALFPIRKLKEDAVSLAVVEFVDMPYRFP